MSVWNTACRVLARHLGEGVRLDHVLEDVPGQLSPVDRRRCRHLVYGGVRHLGLLEACIATHMQRAPRPILRAALIVGAFEILENPGQAPAIIHHAVDRTREIASAAEARVVNAVLRKVAASLADAMAAEIAPGDAVALARRFSHPAWLVARWLRAFGDAEVRRLLAWDQEPAPVHARIVAGVETDALPAFFRSTPWPGFYVLEKPEWSVVEAWLAAGRIYLQDPATAVAPALLAVQPGESVLDVCAAPGGKTLQLAEAAGPTGRVIAVDLPGVRLDRMRDNLRRYEAARGRVSVVACDGRVLSEAILAAERQPRLYDAVLLDAPCSNTGVLRHRVDVKWRLQPDELAGLTELQGALLSRAAARVRPGGRVVYSTCSLEAEENASVVEAFLRSTAGGEFTLEATRRCRPWADGCDGAGAFLLRRA